jgi:PEP-CTERM motif
MKSFVAALGVALIATLGAASTAQALVIDFGVVALGGTIGYSPGKPSTLSNSTELTFTSATKFYVSQVLPGDDSGLVAGDQITLSPMTLDYGSGSGTGLDEALATDITKSWTDAKGTFTETLTTVDAINRGTANAITVTLSGTLTGGGFVDAPVELILSATEAGGPGKIVSLSLTNTGAQTVPEPATWAMMALGFAGLGYAAFRRNAKGRAVAI